MEDKGIDEAMDAAVEDDMIKDALGLSLPPEVVVEGYELVKAFVKYQEAVDRTGKETPLNAMMCVLIDMAVYRTNEIDIDRMKKVKRAWIGARDYLRYPQCDECPEQCEDKTC